MALRTDMAMEQTRQLSGTGEIEGVRQEVRRMDSVSAELTDIRIDTPEAARRLGRRPGRYITLKALDGSFESWSPCFEPRTQLLSRLIRELCPGAGRVLAVGLGNRRMTSDSLGPLCADRLFATRHIFQSRALDTAGLTELSVISPGVLGNTGIEAAEQIRAICALTEPDAVIAVDALACLEPEHLGRTIQLCDTGISPGSGVENSRQELSEDTLGCKCIAIGIPMVADLGSLTEHLLGRAAPKSTLGMTVTPAKADRLAEKGAEYISSGINLAFQHGLTLEEIGSLID